jgi:hypothetical protein
VPVITQASLAALQRSGHRSSEKLEGLIPFSLALHVYPVKAYLYRVYWNSKVICKTGMFKVDLTCMGSTMNYFKVRVNTLLINNS